MHWLKTPNVDLNDIPSQGKDNAGLVTAHVFVFHQHQTILLHDYQEDKWVLPYDALLPNSDQETLTQIYSQQNVVNPASGKSLQDMAIQSLTLGLRDLVLDDLQFTDLLFRDAITIAATTGHAKQPHRNLAIITSASNINLDKIRRDENGLFGLSPFSPYRFDDVKLCNAHETIQMLESAKHGIAREAFYRYAAVATSNVVFPPGLTQLQQWAAKNLTPYQATQILDPNRASLDQLQSWIQDTISTYIDCQLFYWEKQLWNSLPKRKRHFHAGDVMRNFKTAICSQVISTNAQGEAVEAGLIIRPMIPSEDESQDIFMVQLAHGLHNQEHVGWYVWQNGEMEFRWEKAMRAAWVTNDGRLRIRWRQIQ